MGNALSAAYSAMPLRGVIPMPPARRTDGRVSSLATVRRSHPRGRDITANRSWNDERTDNSKNSDPAGASGGTFKSTRCVPSNPAHGERRESRGEGHREDGGLQRWSVRLRDYTARPESPRSVVPITGRILGRTIVRGLGQRVAVFLRVGAQLPHNARH